MRESEKAEAYTAAINLLVDQAVTAANPKSPGAYAGSVRSRLLNDKRDHARALMEDEIPTPEQLAEWLDDTPAVPAPKPTVRYHDEKAGCSTCGCYGGGGWLQSDDRDDTGLLSDLIPCTACAPDRHRLHAREHVREDRADLFAKYVATIEHQREGL